MGCAAILQRAWRYDSCFKAARWRRFLRVQANRSVLNSSESICTDDLNPQNKKEDRGHFLSRASGKIFFQRGNEFEDHKKIIRHRQFKKRKVWNTIASVKPLVFSARPPRPVAQLPKHGSADIPVCRFLMLRRGRRGRGHRRGCESAEKSHFPPR